MTDTKPENEEERKQKLREAQLEWRIKKLMNQKKKANHPLARGIPHGVR